jgi:sugar/nucleoside kinase (ribokinase family)
MTSVTTLFVGLATLDVVHLVERLPTPNEKVVALDCLTAAGGPAANAAVASAYLGATSTLVTALPEHALSDLIRSELEECGVTLSVCPTAAPMPVTASILVTRGSGERAVVSPTGRASGASATPLAPEAVDVVLANVGALQVDGYHPTVAVPLARAARQRGIPVVADLGSFKPHSADLLRHTDIAVVSADFSPPGVSRLPEAVLDYLLWQGCSAAAVTLGADGVAFAVGDTRAHAPAVRVEVADTLGAGDFFHGALTTRIAAEGGDPERFADDVAFAAGIAARSVTSFGTRRWLSA